MPAPTLSVTLQASAITKRYASQLVLEDVDLDVRSGEILALIGENGAGKSTLMRILAGATRPDSGTIDFSGEPSHHRQRAAGAGPRHRDDLSGAQPRSEPHRRAEHLLRPRAGGAGSTRTVGRRRPNDTSRSRPIRRVLTIVGSKLRRLPPSIRLDRRPAAASRDRQGVLVSTPRSSSWMSRPRRSPRMWPPTSRLDGAAEGPWDGHRVHHPSPAGSASRSPIASSCYVTDASSGRLRRRRGSARRRSSR